jgi:hypothetical protein
MILCLILYLIILLYLFLIKDIQLLSKVDISSAPTFHKYCPHIFPSVKALCEALSSTSSRSSREFTEGILRHLLVSYPQFLSDR